MREFSRREALATTSAAALLASPLSGCAPIPSARGTRELNDLLLVNGKITTLDPQQPEVTAVLIRNGRFEAVGTESELRQRAGPNAAIIDLNRRRVVPGLIDSHTHLIRGGLNYNMELRWEGVPSLADAMGMLRLQVQRTPSPHWVRVVGGFSFTQFAEKRLPTLEELNAAAPDTPVFILHLYDRALLNAAALRAVGYTRDSVAPPGSEIVRDAAGNPTGMLIAQPNATLLYSTLAKGPKLPVEYQVNSTRQFMRELNSLGITGVCDAGGGSQKYPDHYAVIEQLHKDDQLTVRISYDIFSQSPKEELAEFSAAVKAIGPGEGDDTYRHNGAGEMLVYSASDFEDFRWARPDMPANMEADLEPVVRLLAENRWPWRLHATYDQTIGRALDVFERVNRDVPFNGLHWFIDHAETISARNIDRIAALGGGIAIQHRMAYQGEFFAERYGAPAADLAPPVKRMLAAGVPVGAGTDATRVASYNPWVCLHWLTAGKSVGGTTIISEANRLDRHTALKLWTEANSWFSNEVGKKGQIKAGQLADLAVLTEDFFSVPDATIPHIRSAMTVVGGRVVFGEGEFTTLAPEPIRALPDWSPVNAFGGYHRQDQADDQSAQVADSQCCCASSCNVHGHRHSQALASAVPVADAKAFWGAIGCGCWAV